MAFRITLLICFFLSALYAADENNESKKSLQAQITELEKRLAVQEKKITVGTKETLFSIGGKIRLDCVINSPGVGAAGGSNDYDFYLTPKSISTLRQTNMLALSAKDSLFWFKTRRQTELGKLETLLEVDFRGSAGTETVTNSHNLRLRHAYLSLDNITIGQTYTTFMGSGNSDTMQQAINIILVRQPLIRFTYRSGALRYDLSLESPETTLTTAAGTVTANDDQLPDIAARLTYSGSFGEVSCSALSRQIRIDRADLNSSDSSESAFAINLGGTIKTVGNDAFRFGWMQGNGVGRYIAYNYFTAGSLDSTGNITLLPLTSYHLSYQHWWDKNLRSSLLFGYISAENDINIAPLSATKNAYSAHINLRYTPFQNALVTLEYIKAEKRNLAEETSILNRLYLSMSYDF